MYRPLPPFLEIRESNIEGVGIFARTKIKAGKILGMTHYYNKLDMGSGLIRTPLGGFINHSENPNCMRVIKKYRFYEISKIRAIKNIKKGEEITLKYTMYDPKKDR